MRLLNLGDVELGEGPGREGFSFRGSAIGSRLRAARIGAGLYEAYADTPIWPYHYHYPDEEWLIVLDGSPVLREPAGRRTLRTGDVVCFPAGHRGAHTMEGPGRFLIISTLRATGPFLSVYPDSDKVSVFPGGEPGGLNALRLPRAGSVDYWHGEGSGAVADAPVVREPSDVPRRPVVSLRDADLRLGARVGGRDIDGAVATLEGDGDLGPYRYEHGRETWLLLLSGSVDLHHADGVAALRAGDVVCLPDGPAGGRRVAGRGDAPARVLHLWTTGVPAAVCLPDSGEWELRVDADASSPPIRLCGDDAR